MSEEGGGSRGGGNRANGQGVVGGSSMLSFVCLLPVVQCLLSCAWLARIMSCLANVHERAARGSEQSKAVLRCDSGGGQHG